MASKVKIPPKTLEQLRSLHIRREHHLEVLRLVQELCLEFDRAALSFANAHGVEQDQIERIDLDEGDVILKDDHAESV